MDTLIYTQSSERIPLLQKDLDPSTTLAVHTDLGATLVTLQANTFQKIIIELASLSEFNKDTLHQLYNILKPDGTLHIQHTPELSQDIAHLKDGYTIAGFKEDSTDSSNLVLKKPSWAGKGVATLKKKGGAVKIDASDDGEKKANPFAKFAAQETSNKELVNEDNLLENETEYNPLGKDESCSTKPKACANCSCGRAELEAMEEAGNVNLEKKIETGKVESSCGNCYLGDAFRCASCPYKGLPAFKPGDKVKLDLSKDGLGGVLKEENDVVVANGKVKLQI